MLSQEIRRNFLRYFKEKGHKVIPSSSVIPSHDPTLLFINAGMNQFKDIFLGKRKEPYSKAASSQKCIRVGGKHNDLENVGHTFRHLTFFEMLGNFSFGDYFKKEAIAYAFEVSTEVFGLDPAFFWASVFETDDESFELWKKHLPEERIVRLGEKDNFWTMGEVGPCGPCSELLYDRGDKFGKGKTPLEDPTGERFLEFWNLVFMQYDRDSDQTLTPLPKQNIDTGAGLERIALLKMGVDHVFQTDILQALIYEVEKISQKKYNPVTAVSFHVIADHFRSLAFAIADGAVPSNIERGYVLRKILRRAARYGRSLGFTDPFLSGLTSKLIELMGSDFPELIRSKKRIEEILETEEISFIRTLDRGKNLLGQIIEKTKDTISGEDAFKLKDTYGFPIEEILLIAKDANLTVDLDTYKILEEQAKALSKKASSEKKERYEPSLFEGIPFSKFIGYDHLSSDSTLTAIFQEGIQTSSLEEGEEGALILEKTPFYAEMGGQVADKGTISTDEGIFEVTQCIAPKEGIILHIGSVRSGVIQNKVPCKTRVNETYRKEISANHSATHLLHFALSKVLGDHIKQAGSLVEDLRLRFDFNHHKGLEKSEIRQIEELINEMIRLDLEVKIYEKSYEQVQEDPEVKQFFEDKYQDTVRVVDMDFSKELCGGTHVKRLGEIGFFKIKKQSSIASGIRRIEACTGKYAEKLIYEKEDLIESIASTLNTTSSKVLPSIDRLIEEKQALSSQMKQQKLYQRKQEIVMALKQIQSIQGISLIAIESSIEPSDLNTFADEIMHELKSGVIALAVKGKDKCQLLVRVSPDLIDRSIYANDLIKQIAPLIDGGGGGKKESAQAGGKNPLQVPLALTKLKQILEEL